MNLELGDTQLIIHAAKRHGLLRNQLAYVLATTYHETAFRMEPVRETLADSDESAKARLERAWTKGQLPWVRKPYWRDNWFGRGYVQLTHEYNYVRATKEIGIDFVADPIRALEADHAVEILIRGMMGGWFHGKGLGLAHYVDLKKSDYVGARRTVNGTDKARAIAEHARDYEDALIAVGYGVEKKPPVANERRDGTPARSNQMQSKQVRGLTVAGLATVTGMSEDAKELIGEVSSTLNISPSAALGLIVVGALLYVYRERWLKWIDGDR